MRRSFTRARRTTIATALAAAVLAGGVNAAGRDGGTSIGSAPDLTLGEVEYGAPENGARFWRIPLVHGDSLTST